MKLVKITFFIILVLCFSQVSQAQLFFGVKGGLAASQFEDQEEAASNFVAGAAIGTDVMPMLDLGIEYEMLVSPFEMDFIPGSSMKIKQSMVGVFGKLYPLPVDLEIVDPYVRAGVGYYMGNLEVENVGDKDFKGAVGFNAGVGTDTILGLYVEAVFHIIKREFDDDDETIDLGGMNYLTVMVGFNF